MKQGIDISLKDLKNERWLPIGDYPNYIVSNMGRIARVRELWKKGSNRGKHDYLYFRMSIKYTRQPQLRVSRVVATAFLKKKHKTDVVNHKDGNPLNNKVENLEWCTVSENNFHAYRTGLR